MTPLLSAALLAAPGKDILLSAYIGVMSPEEAADYQANGPTNYPGRFAHCLLGTFPDLGASVRNWPKFAEELEQKGRIPRIKPNQNHYRRDVHVSLWKVLTSLQEQGMGREQISELLRKHGL